MDSPQTGSDDVLTREMGCTEADFARWLPGATRYAPVETTVDRNGTRHRIVVNQGTVDILLRVATPRRIAGIVLPVLVVSFRFNNLDQVQRNSFLGYFDAYTRRGGG